MNAFTTIKTTIAAFIVFATGCDSGQQIKSNGANAQALSSLELKTGVGFPTNAVVVHSGDGGGREAGHQFHEWETNGFGFPATVVRGTEGDYLVVTQGKL